MRKGVLWRGVLCAVLFFWGMTISKLLDFPKLTVWRVDANNPNDISLEGFYKILSIHSQKFETFFAISSGSDSIAFISSGKILLNQ